MAIILIIYFFGQMIELVKGSGVYWTSVHEKLANEKAANGTQLALALTDIFFDQSTLAISNAKGGGTGGYKPLCDKTRTSIIGKYAYFFSGGSRGIHGFHGTPPLAGDVIFL